MAWNNASRTAWSLSEDRQVLTLLAAGKSACAIAKVLNRSESSVYRRIEILTRKKQEEKTRPCLCCGQQFASAGSHNRLCGACRAEARNVSPYAL